MARISAASLAAKCSLLKLSSGLAWMSLQIVLELRVHAIDERASMRGVGFSAKAVGATGERDKNGKRKLC